ncbi:MAG TPA: cyanophycin synthetase, partial [Anaeromyxobacteraceae bacterium]
DGAPERYAVRSRALRGRHNLENAMAAALCARLLGVDAREVQAGLDAFRGLPHRLELVRERAGVEWVNDSKATNVDSTVVGLSAGDLAPERYEVRSRALRGRHNLENAMAAALCARLLGVPGREVQAGLDAFPGLPHRLELVRERGGVEWVNDSKATNVDSTAVGLVAFPAGRPHVVLILGGRGKRAPYAPLRPLFQDRVKAVLTIGEDAPALSRELAGAAPIEPVETLAAAVERAAALTGSGDVVLLSPACASFDQFKSYEHRGETFRQLVAALP